MEVPTQQYSTEVAHSELNTCQRSRHGSPKTPAHIAAIREIEKGLETNLKEYMKFLQILSKDTRSMATADWVSKEGLTDGGQVDSNHNRPGTSPPHFRTEIQTQVEAHKICYDFDESAVSDVSGGQIPIKTHELRNRKAESVVSEVSSDWDASSQGQKIRHSIHVLPTHGEIGSDWVKTEPTKIHPNGRVRAWSTEPSESQTPNSVLSSTGSQKDKSGSENIQVSVCVRMRPFREHEKLCPLRQVLCSQIDKVIVKDYNHLRQIPGTKSKEERLQFDVDYVMDDSYVPHGNRKRKEDSQRRMFETLGKPCLENGLNGYNTTILAYGQMGSGKTYTMMGDGTFCGRGLVPRLVHELMHCVHRDRKNGLSFSIQVSFLEIYQEKVRDLLVEKKDEHKDEDQICHPNIKRVDSPNMDGRSSSFSFYGTGHVKKDYLRVREHPVTGPYVEGLLWKDVTTCGEMEKLVKQGAENRTFGHTHTHRLSSRGHTLFTIKLIRGHLKDELGGTTSSYINLVDLAGSEKLTSIQKRSAERTYESKYINRSLSQLNDVITNLSRSNRSFVSYRSSALTWLLRGSLGGQNKTFLVANISPAEQDFQESVHTLRCAAKANRIHGLICQDQDPRKQIFLKMNEEIRTLQYLIGDLTKKTSDASEELRPIKKILDTSYDLRPTREIMHNEENAVERKSVENIIQQRPPSRFQGMRPAGSVPDNHDYLLYK